MLSKRGWLVRCEGIPAAEQRREDCPWYADCVCSYDLDSIGQAERGNRVGVWDRVHFARHLAGMRESLKE